MGREALEGLIGETLAAWKPPRRLPLSEWADEHGRLSTESAHEGGRWHCYPYQREPMDAVTDPTVERITFEKGTRVGFTKILNLAIAYHIVEDPCSILMVQPTIEDAEGYSKEEIAPMIRDMPALHGKVQDAKTRSGENTLLHKLFPGGILSMVGANSPRGFRRISRRLILLDEVDGYPASAGTEGDPVKLAIDRSEFFWNRKIIAGSKPTERDASRIEGLFQQSDQRRRFLPCPHCKHMQFLEWGGRDVKHGIKWPAANPWRAYYVCVNCAKEIDHRWLRWMDERGEWRQTAAQADGRHRGYHIWSGYSYSPNSTWGHLAEEWVKDHAHPLLLRTFINSKLGETWEDEYAARAGAQDLRDRGEPYEAGSVPDGGLALVASVDVQHDRLAIAIEAFDEGEQSWLVRAVEIHGDTSRLTGKPDDPSVWEQAGKLLDAPCRGPKGRDMYVRVCLVDSGDQTHTVYMWVHQRLALYNAGKSRCYVTAGKGASKPGRPVIGRPTKQDVNYQGKVIKKGVELYLVGTENAKAAIYARLKIQDDGPGCMHFPLEGLPDDYFEQLTAEKQKLSYQRGFPRKVWVKAAGARNEWLDVKVGCLAALQILIARSNRTTLWDQLRAALDQGTESALATAGGRRMRSSGLRG